MNGYGGANGVHAQPMSLDEQQAAFIRQAAQAQGAPNLPHLAQQPPRPQVPPSAFNGSMAPQAGNGVIPQPPHSAATAQQQALLLRQQQAARQASGSTPLSAPTDGGPPFAVPVYPLFTRITPMEPGVEFPFLEPADQQRVKSWMERDLAYEKELLAAKRTRKTELNGIAQEVFTREDWLGGPDERPPARMRIRMEADRSREHSKGKRGAERKEIRMSKEQLRATARVPEVLIPIRLDYEHEAYKLRDTFTWNLRETIITPEIFASHLCADLRLPYHSFYKEVVSQIKRHIEEAQLTENYTAHFGDDLASIREESRRWFETKAFKRRKITTGDEDTEMGESTEEGAPLTLRDFPRQEGLNDELRVTIKLDITLDNLQLVDKFEWDISDSRNSPEAFAETFAAESGLSGEFRTAIAHSIREQVDVYTKSLCILGHVKGVPIQDEDLRREFLPSLFEPFRAEADDYTPLLNQLTPDEVERNDKEREREVRRKRRQTKGRGVTLPDREFVKTHRTLVPKPNTDPIASFQDHRGDMVYPMPELSHPYPLALPPPIAKPADLETVPSSPLKLVPTQGSVLVPMAAEALKAGGSRLKRLKQNPDGTFAPFDSTSGSATPGDATPHGATPVPEPPKKVAKPKVPKKVTAGPSAVNLEALGLHPHLIEGAWHCANCGVPESAAVGRRKGPSGANSLCGQCGKYFHRYRRQRPCTYTTDLETHLRFKAEAEAAAAVAAETAAVASPRASTRATDADGEQRVQRAAGRPKPRIRDSSDEDSDDSDDSAAPLKNRRARGQSPDLPFVQIGSPDSDNSSTSAPSPPATQLGGFPAPAPTAQPPAAAPAPAVAPASSSSAPEPLPWMKAAAADLRAKQVDDRFEIIPRPRPPDPNLQEWRIRCLDCPGKLYNLGPGETLDNFSVHFKNRVHRGNVDARLKGGK